MFRTTAVSTAFCIFLSLQTTAVALASAEGKCTRASLQEKADAYVAALKSGTPSRMPLSSEAKYIENRKEIPFGSGIWRKLLVVDFYRSILDVETCQTFTEVISATGDHPYVIGTRLQVADGRVAEVEALVTDENDWLFNAANYLKYSSRETWNVIPVPLRGNRADLISAANAYFDVFKDPSSANDVPWNIPCARLEGGVYSNPDDDPQASCTGGPPLEGSVDIVNRRFLVDLDMGAVVGLVNFGDENGWPDTHIFRLENGKIRYIHTLTVCPNGCVLPSAKE